MKMVNNADTCHKKVKDQQKLDISSNRLQRLISGPVGPIMERQHQTTYDRCGARLSQIPNDGSYQPPTTAALSKPSLTDVTDACNEYMKKG